MKPLRRYLGIVFFGVMIRDLVRLGVLMLLGLMFSDGTLSPLVLFMGFLSIASSSAFANIVNDIYDLELDGRTKAYRPLPSGKYTVNQAWGASIAFLALAIFTSLGAFLLSSNGLLLFILLVTPLGCFAYSGTPIRLKARSWSGVATISLIYLTPLLTGFVIGSPGLHSLPLVTLMFYTIFLASAVKDFEDVEVDGSMGVITPPVKHGIGTAANILKYTGIMGVVLAVATAAGYLVWYKIPQGAFSLALIPPLMIYVRRIRKYSESYAAEDLMVLVKGCLWSMYVWPFVAAIILLFTPRVIG